MKHYTITLHNEEKDQWKERAVEKHTFPEAVLAANQWRAKMGHAWNIVSIYRDEKVKGGKNA